MHLCELCICAISLISPQESLNALANYYMQEYQVMSGRGRGLWAGCVLRWLQLWGPPSWKGQGPHRETGILTRNRYLTQLFWSCFFLSALRLTRPYQTSRFPSSASFQDHLIRRETDFLALHNTASDDKACYMLFCSTHVVTVTCNQNSNFFHRCYYH